MSTPHRHRATAASPPIARAPCDSPRMKLAGSMIMLGLALAACGGSKTTATPKAATCEDAAAHAEAVVAADTSMPNAAEMAGPIRGLVADHCAADGWSADVIACITASPTHDALHGCLHTLTEDQHAKFHAAVEATMGAEGHDHMMMKDAPAGAPPPPDSTQNDPCGGGE